MNIFGLFGISDIVIIFLFVIMIFIGWKKGFLEKFVKIANSIFGLIFSLIFAGKFANFIGPRGFNSLIQPKVYNNVIQSSAIQNISADNISSGVTNVLKELGFPGFLSDMIAKLVGSSFPGLTVESLQQQIATAISNQMTKFIVVIIAFLLLFIGTSILAFLLKLIIKALRTSKLIKTADGILGVVFMTVMFFLLMYVSLLIVSLLMQVPSLGGFNEFMMKDMQLSTEKFRLSKYFYENNIIGNLFKIFF